MGGSIKAPRGLDSGTPMLQQGIADLTIGVVSAAAAASRLADGIRNRRRQ